MVLVSDECANILSCNVKSLRDILNHPENQKIILKVLEGQKVETTYKDRNGLKNKFIIGGLSNEGANIVQAYGRLSKPFNICVAAHYYAKHRIRLNYPYLHCIIQKFSSSSKNGKFKENRYYPMELLELIKEDKEEEKIINNFCENYTSTMITNHLKNDNKLVIVDEEDEEEENDIFNPNNYCNGW